MKVVIAAFALACSCQAIADGSVVDLGSSFVCMDVSPTPMRITDKGLVMGGVVYPLINPNASSSPTITNAIFGSADGLSEIDVHQNENGGVSVSYMKFRVNPIDAGGDPDKFKIFEKASFGVEEPPAYFHSKNRGCRN
ncbi:hypothetical protein ACQVA2_13725 [Citrobacter sp. OP27]